MLDWLFEFYAPVALWVGLAALALTLVLALVLAFAGPGPQTTARLLPGLLAAGLTASHLALWLLGQRLAQGYADEREQMLALLVAFAAGGLGALLAYRLLQEGGPLREAAQRMRDPARRRESLGSAHFCYPGEFARLQKAKGEHELRLRGAFYGKRGRGEAGHRFYRLDRGPGRNNALPGIALSAEDQARGLSLIGPPGTGKSQAGILPIAADSLRTGQSLIVLDPQGELLPYLADFARVTGHRLLVHDPSDPGQRRFNLADGVASVSDAQAVAGVITGAGGEDFWNKSARNLLAACLLRFESLGAILRALDDLPALAERLLEQDDGAADSARAFAASVRSGDRSAPGVVATLQASTLGAWAEPAVREATAASDFRAADLVAEPALLVLRCPGRAMSVYGPYLGAVLQRLLLDLDSLAEASPGGALSRPLKVLIDEFPLMGRLDALVAQVNLFRKRRISVVIAAQSFAQLERLYGRSGAEALLAGMATQVWFGACDASTARFVSGMLGRATERDAKPLPGATEAALRGRELLSVDEVISPPVGSCTLLHRTATSTYAAQLVLLAALTPFYQREDWASEIGRARSEALPEPETRLFRAERIDPGVNGLELDAETTEESY